MIYLTNSSGFRHYTLVLFLINVLFEWQQIGTKTGFSEVENGLAKSSIELAIDKLMLLPHFSF